ncbi:alpha/beta hydrolase family protein [Embleya sp. NBC_00888]|uniref:alpha/beta hydrolase n=1 Tax=Embleya sp. NBC_00888 TaxID=2975960 RepID=UPI0038679E73|nr:alpha/beta hydrolase family protein [Embleya sp. NBC_00888]
MVTLAQLRDAALGGLDRAVVEWTDLAAALDGLVGRATTGVGGPLRASRWEGADADAAARGLAARGEQVMVAAQEARCVLTVLDTAADQLRNAQRDLWAGLAEAAAAGFTVFEDGRMEPADPTHRADVAMISRRHELEQLLAAPVRKATEVDTHCAETLARLYPTGTADWADTAADGTCVMALAGLDLATIPRGDPVAAAKWWAGLNPSERAMYLAGYPAVLGAMDGLPTEIRDRANRVALAEAKAALIAELAAARAKRDAAGRTDDAKWRLRVTALKERLAAIEGLEATLRSGDDLYLMGFSAKGDGRAIVAIGNPDTAAHTAVYVPGTGASLAKVGKDVQRVRRLLIATERYTKPGEVSAIAWLSYDAPDTLVHALSSSDAEAGASKLKYFLRGVGVAQGVSSQRHITVIGHSYGSVVIGEAAKSNGGIYARDIIVAGSPGTHVSKAGDLNLPGNHVWVTLAEGDPVSTLGSGAHAPAVKEKGIWNRVTPDDRSFGANRMSAEGAHGHSEYWDGEHPDSLDNQAAVIAGRYEEVNLLWGSRP